MASGTSSDERGGGGSTEPTDPPQPTGLQTWSAIRETSGEITSTELRFACGSVLRFSLKSIMNGTVGVGSKLPYRVPTTQWETRRTHLGHCTDGTELLPASP